MNKQEKSNKQDPVWGVRFIKHNHKDINSLVGERWTFDIWENIFIKVYDLHYIKVGKSDKVCFYGNKQNDLCLRFVQDFSDEDLIFMLTDVYRYPEFYEKSKDEINNDLIHSTAMGLAIRKELKSLLKNEHGIDDNDFSDCLIDAYQKLKNEGRLK
jgi:hypothetical protein